MILGSVAPILPLFSGASTAYAAIKADLDQHTTIDGTSDEGRILSTEGGGRVEIKNVTFAYASERNVPALNNISLILEGKKHTAIIGPSGSGKSTLASLVARLYDPSEGSIYLDGNNLRDVNVKNLRGQIGFVQQEPLLLDRSIFENIAVGLTSSSLPKHQSLKAELSASRLAELSVSVSRKDVNAESSEIVKLVHEAASLANAKDFVDSLEYGFGTMIGTEGQQLSGGQKQRVALARALIREPKILILDEATAALDAESERKIIDAVERVRVNTTVISVAHRIPVIQRADKVFVLKGGEIVEQGTPSEILAKTHDLKDVEGLEEQAKGGEGIQPLTTNHLPSTEGQLVAGLDEKPNEKYEPSISTEPASKESTTSTLSGDISPPPLDPKTENQKSRIFRALIPLVRPSLLWLVFAIIAAAVVGCTFPASALIFGHTVEALNPCNKTVERLLYLGRFFGGLLFMLAVVELFANFFSWFFFGIVAENLLLKVRSLSFHSLFQQDYAWHRSADRNANTLHSIISKDSMSLAQFSGSMMGTIMGIVINFFVAIILSHIIAWKIAIVCLVTVPILLGAGFMQLKSIAGFERRHAKAYAKATDISVETVKKFKTIASFSLEDEVMEDYRRALEAPKKEMAVASAYTNMWYTFAICTGFFIYAFVYWWGSRQIVNGEYNQRQFFIVLTALVISAQLWGQMFTLAPEISKAYSAAGRILGLVQLGSENSGSSKPATSATEKFSGGLEKQDIEAAAETASDRPLKRSDGLSITFNNVSFSYPSRSSTTPSLKQVSFSIQPGKFCGLVGPSGAGKSTIMNLIQRHYHPTNGAIEIGGTDARYSDFRPYISVVPQDNVLFDGSIKFNVGLGAVPGHEATQEEVEEACRLANIHDTIATKFKEGYDTQCGPAGSWLSGGERQRLAIARALIRKPKILLLDESTSALDAENERNFFLKTLELCAETGVTVVVISHHLHVLERADMILVLEEGKLVASGPHKELLQSNEMYAGHYRLQQSSR